jgi:hypothetical protein
MSSYAYWKQWDREDDGLEIEEDENEGFEPEYEGGTYLMDRIEWDFREFI